MEIKEVVLDAWVPGKRKIKKKKEKWYSVKFGDKEFLMPKETKDNFTNKLYHNSKFSFYFDGNKFLTDDRYHIPEESDRIKYHHFVVLSDHVELFKPENLTLLAKENGLSLYLIKNKNEPIAYKLEAIYAVINYPYISIKFEKERPVNEETYDLLNRLRYYNDNSKYIKIDGTISFTNIKILDYNDVKVYTVEDTDKHRIIAIENAELIRFANDYIAIKGDKTYLAMDQYYRPISSNLIKIGKVKAEYKNKHRMYEYIAPNAVKKLIQYPHSEYYEGNLNAGYIKITSDQRNIVEIPSLDSEIVVRTWIRKAEPILDDIEYRLDEYKEYTYQEKYVTETGEIKTSTTTVSFPIQLKYKMLEPELIEEQTFNVKDFINKSVEIGK